MNFSFTPHLTSSCLWDMCFDSFQNSVFFFFLPPFWKCFQAWRMFFTSDEKTRLSLVFWSYYFCLVWEEKKGEYLHFFLTGWLGGGATRTSLAYKKKKGEKKKESEMQVKICFLQPHNRIDRKVGGWRGEMNGPAHYTELPTGFMANTVLMPCFWSKGILQTLAWRLQEWRVFHF